MLVKDALSSFKEGEHGASALPSSLMRKNKNGFVLESTRIDCPKFASCAASIYVVVVVLVFFKTNDTTPAFFVRRKWIIRDNKQ